MNRVSWITLIFLATFFAFVEASSQYAQHPRHGNRYPVKQESTCDGITGDCEDTMESDVNRRMLAQSGYISYGALQRDRVPCNVRGNSYYNCNSKQQANPYNRGCTQITYCARNNH